MNFDEAYMSRIARMQYPGDTEAMDQGEAMGLEQAAMQATVGTLPQSEVQDGQGSIREIPRNAFEQLLGKIGEGLTAAGVELDKVGIELPGLGRVSLKDVTIGDVGKVMEDMSYGFMPTRGAGGIGGTAGLKPEALELANLPVVTGAASLAGKGAVAAGKAGAKFVAPKVGEMLDQYMRRSGLTMDLMAYHGTPYRFEKFDASKIGTGEGAQAYGYGIYFAEDPNVARRYRIGLTQGRGEDVTYKGKLLADVYADIENKSMKLSGKAADIENQKLQILEHLMLDKSPEELISYAKNTGFDQSVIDWLEKDVSKNISIPGSFYSVDIPDEMVSRMLDWDKTLSEQSIEVRQFVQELRNEPGDPYNLERFFNPKNPNKGPLGSEIYEAIVNRESAKARELVRNGQYIKDTEKHGELMATEQMRQSGIFGVRYLDQGSRGAGEGTRNIVVFPGGEDQIKILKVE